MSKRELAKAAAELAECAAPEAAARACGHDDQDGVMPPDLMAAFSPLNAYAQQVMLAPAGHLQNLLSLQEALTMLHAQAVAAAQAARVEEHKRARDAEHPIVMSVAQPEAEGSEAAAPKKAKPSDLAAGAEASMEVEPGQPDPCPSGPAGTASPGRGTGRRPASAGGSCSSRSGPWLWLPPPLLWVGSFLCTRTDG